MADKTGSPLAPPGAIGTSSRARRARRANWPSGAQIYCGCRHLSRISRVPPRLSGVATKPFLAMFTANPVSVPTAYSPIEAKFNRWTSLAECLVPVMG